MLNSSKINLFLKVTGRCDNSYHNIRTLFVPLSEPSDEVSIDFNGNSGIKIICDAPQVPCDERNICFRAASGYAELCEVSPDWEIRLQKNIPIAAGMGGGSSDAAAVLLILNRHYEQLSSSELAALALKCGADVPFFLCPRPALASGVGEVLTYPELHLPDIPMLLINPGFPISAAWAYKQLDKNIIGEVPEGYEEKLFNALMNVDIGELSHLIFNDLAVACYRKFPILRILRDQLLETGAAVQITGSGPTLFALYRTVDERNDAAVYFADKYPQMTVISSKF